MLSGGWLSCVCECDFIAKSGPDPSQLHAWRKMWDSGDGDWTLIQQNNVLKRFNES